MLNRNTYKMKTSQVISLFIFSFLGLLLIVSAAQESEKEDVNVDENKLTYAKGSLCGYCDYCKFCKLCDADCPCETSASKPNCHMCKYCKFCYVCKACDAICQPGGILDTVTAAIVNALPSHNPDEISKDIEGVQDWIEKKKDEL